MVHHTVNQSPKETKTYIAVETEAGTESGNRGFSEPEGLETAATKATEHRNTGQYIGTH